MKIKDNSVLPVCAVRYALGRQSYMPSSVMDEVTTLFEQLPDNDLEVLKRDLREYLQQSAKTSDVYWTSWNEFYHKICAEIKRRKQCQQYAQ